MIQSGLHTIPPYRKMICYGIGNPTPLFERFLIYRASRARERAKYDRRSDTHDIRYDQKYETVSFHCVHCVLCTVVKYDSFPSFHLRCLRRYRSTIPQWEVTSSHRTQLPDQVRRDRHYRKRWRFFCICGGALSPRWLSRTSARYLRCDEATSTQANCLHVRP